MRAFHFVVVTLAVTVCLSAVSCQAEGSPAAPLTKPNDKSDKPLDNGKVPNAITTKPVDVKAAPTTDIKADTNTKDAKAPTDKPAARTTDFPADSETYYREYEPEYRSAYEPEYRFEYKPAYRQPEYYKTGDYQPEYKSDYKPAYQPEYYQSADYQPTHKPTSYGHNDYGYAAKDHGRCWFVQAEEVQQSCGDAFRAVGVDNLAKPQQILSNILANETICAVAECPHGGYLTGTSISAWPPAWIVPVVTYTDADAIIAARPDTVQKATKVMGMWQWVWRNNGIPAAIQQVGNPTDATTRTLSAFCAVCDHHHNDHHDNHYEHYQAAAAN